MKVFFQGVNVCWMSFEDDQTHTDIGGNTQALKYTGKWIVGPNPTHLGIFDILRHSERIFHAGQFCLQSFFYLCHVSLIFKPMHSGKEDARVHMKNGHFSQIWVFSFS